MIDFEEITTKEVAYFLHRNKNLDPELEIVANVTEACKRGDYELIKDRNRITQIRDTIESYFMITSQTYILVLMFILAILAVYAIPVKLREHHIPMLFRQADENMFSVIMRAMIFAYFYFIILCGCMPSVSMYRTNDTCLHTGADKSWGSIGDHEFKTAPPLDVGMTDYYSVCLAMFVWFITAPILLYMIFAYFKDASRYLLIPIVVANLVFLFGCTLLSIVCIVVTILHANSRVMQVTTLVNVLILCWTILMNRIYVWKFSKKDLLRTEDD